MAILSLLLLLPEAPVHAQSPEVREARVAMSQGERSGYVVAIEGVEEKLSQKTAERFFRDIDRKAGFDKVSKGEYLVNDIILTEISPQPIDVYVLVDGQNRHTGTGADLIADPEVARMFLGARAEA